MIYFSPSSSEICSNMGVTGIHSSTSTNLTTVASNSCLSLSSRGKRRAPTPPNKPPVKANGDTAPRPTAIPEESECVQENGTAKPTTNGDVSKAPEKLPCADETSVSTQKQINEVIADEKEINRPCSPASSQISSVSSLSSIEQPAQQPTPIIESQSKIEIEDKNSSTDKEDVLSSELEVNSSVPDPPSLKDSSTSENSSLRPPTPPPPSSTTGELIIPPPIQFKDDLDSDDENDIEKDWNIFMQNLNDIVRSQQMIYF